MTEYLYLFETSTFKGHVEQYTFCSSYIKVSIQSETEPELINPMLYKHLMTAFIILFTCSFNLNLFNHNNKILKSLFNKTKPIMLAMFKERKCFRWAYQTIPKNATNGKSFNFNLLF